MKEKFKLIIVFIIGVVVSVIISTYTFVKVREEKQVKYEDKKELNSTSDPDYISGVYSSSNSINSNLSVIKTYSTGTVTAGANFTKSSLNNLSKKGNVVQVSITGYSSSSGIAKSTTFATIPSGYIPKNQLIIPVIFSGRGTAYNGAISTNGEVFMTDNAIPASTWITLSATYITD